MEELTINKFQAEQIENTFRIVARVLKSKSKTTCLDRDIMQSWEMIKNVINEDYTKKVNRY